MWGGGANVTLRDRILDLLQSGRAAEARPLCETWCREQPGAESWNLFGAVEAASGHTDRAAECFRTALAADPDFLKARRNLAQALQSLGRRDEAISAYREVLARAPDDIDALYALTDLLAEAGHSDEAIALSQRLVAVEPRAVNHYNLALLLHMSGRFEGAAQHYRRAVALEPDHAEAHNQLGILAVQERDLVAAESHYRAAIAARPDYPEALLGLATILQAREEYAPALAACERALAARPDYPEAGIARGILLARLGRAQDAVAQLHSALASHPDAAGYEVLAEVCYEATQDYKEALGACDAALALDPSYAPARRQRARIWSKVGNNEAAKAECRELLAADPRDAESWQLLAQAMYRQGRPAESRECYGEVLKLRPGDPAAQSNRLFFLNYADSCTPNELFRAHREWGAALEAAVSPLPPPAPGACERRLRVGYLSPDFRRHSVSFFLEPILRRHDHEQFEIYAYAALKPQLADEVTDRLRGLCDHWRDVAALSDREAAERIRQDGVDILVELAGHSGNGRVRVAAFRPAPVQVSYLGYPTTTGLSSIQFRLTDAMADPPGQEHFYSEQLLRLPRGFLCYQPPEDAPECAPPPAGATGRVTFGSFNNLAKVSDAVIARWSEILRRVAGSRLLLKNKSLFDPAAADHTRARFAAHGIGPERLELIGWTRTVRDHLGLYDRVDIALDTFPYNGATTTCEALWMGVPVITLAGDRHAARVGASILSHLGRPEWIARDGDDYVDRAVRLAGDPDRLSGLRAVLREQVRRSPLCDAVRFTRDLEAIYRTLWTETARSNRPAS